MCIRDSPNHDEAGLRGDAEGLEAAEAERAWCRHWGRLQWELARRAIAHGRGDGPDVSGSRAAAAAHDVEPALRGPIANLRGEGFGRLREAGGGERIGEAGIGIRADEDGGDAAELFYISCLLYTSRCV